MTNQEVGRVHEALQRRFKGVKPTAVAKVVQTCHALLFADNITNPHRIKALLDRELQTLTAENREVAYTVIGTGILMDYRNTTKGQNLTDARIFFSRELAKQGIRRSHLSFELCATDTVPV